MKKLAAMIFLVLLAGSVYGATPFQPYDVTGADIATTRGDTDASWRIEALTSQAVPNSYGYILDNGDTFVKDGYWGVQSFAVRVVGIESAPAITAGDVVTFTYLTESGGGALTQKVYFPAVTYDITLYVDTAGQTYSEATLTTKVGSTPTPTPTAAPTATAAPSSTPSPTPAPTATPSPTPFVGTFDAYYQNSSTRDRWTVVAGLITSRDDTPTPTPTPSVTPTPTAAPTATPTAVPTAIP